MNGVRAKTVEFDNNLYILTLKWIKKKEQLQETTNTYTVTDTTETEGRLGECWRAKNYLMNCLKGIARRGVTVMNRNKLKGKPRFICETVNYFLSSSLLVSSYLLSSPFLSSPLFDCLLSSALLRYTSLHCTWGQKLLYKFILRSP